MLALSIATLTARTAVGVNVDVAGTIRDATTHEPVAGAHVTGMDVHGVADAHGSFRIASVRKGTMLRVSADNFDYVDVVASDSPVDISLRRIAITE